MKALSLWQPYASFMSHDLKWNETRGRYTYFRGELAICSTKRNWLPGEFGEEVENISNMMSTAWYQENKLKRPEDRPTLFPKGFVLCVVTVVDCRPTDNLAVSPLEKICGYYSAGRFAWITRGCRKLNHPVPVCGHQGFFNLPPDVEAKVKAQL